MSLNSKRYLKYVVFVVAALVIVLVLHNNLRANQANRGGLVIMNKDKVFQTGVEGAEVFFDENGVPFWRVKGLGDIRHPGGIAVFALQYAGLETYTDEKLVDKDLLKFRNCVDWLINNKSENKKGDLVWIYNFDNTYNNVFIKAPWYSSFGQAVIIDALIASYKIDGNNENLALAEKAAFVLFRPIPEGGLLFQKGDDIWFEEMLVPAENPTHILNGHMRTLIALKKLAEATGKSDYQDWFDRGVKTLERWLPLYDNGYWFRYDLNPKKDELLFRFTNPYCFKLTDLAIDKITLRDPDSGEEVSLDVGAPVDPEGSVRIAGNDWGQPEVIDGRTVRRLVPVTPATAQEDADGNMHAPGTYFYLKLPSEWTDNLREGWFELIVDYKDEKSGNVTVQTRSIAPGPAFRDLRDGDLLLSGSGQWRQWRIPVRTTDLGWWVGESYAEKHVLYMEELAKYDGNLKVWADVARGYLNIIKSSIDGINNIVKVNPMVLPEQTPMLPIYSLDRNGVVLQHHASKNSRFINGLFDPNSDHGYPVYQYFVIATQLIEGSDLTGGAYSEIDRNAIKREPALKWLMGNQNFTTVKDAAVYKYGFNNSYNDIITQSPWQSAFGQAFVVKSFLSAIERKLDNEVLLKEHLERVINAFKYEVCDDGVVCFTRKGMRFAEEVPNATHVLNAHLASSTALEAASNYLRQEENNNVNDLINSIYEYIYTFDTGCWSRYDQNPKKELLFQIDWLSGDKSPAIDEIDLKNPQTGTVTRIDVGSNDDFTSYPYLSGTDWLSSESLDGRTVRHFGNGYDLHHEAVEGGTRHNVFFLIALPERSFTDYFDVPSHHLVIRYKDEAQGEFIVKTQSINEGNVLAFGPLRRGVIKCVGDGLWKEAVFELRPQDMGWYMGPDYQRFHVEQLKELANQTGDWFFAQYAEKWQYFLDAYEQKKEVIIQDKPGNLHDISSEIKVVDSSPVYPGYGVENALDGDPNDDYVAFLDGSFPQYFTLDLNGEKVIQGFEFIWESEENYGTDYQVEAIDKEGAAIEITNALNQQGKIQGINLSEYVKASALRFTVHNTAGQSRVLLRQLKVFSY